MAATRSFDAWASGRRTSRTWAASSLVGTRTRPRGWPSVARSMRWARGMAKARVLPEPVLALPHTWRPARASATTSDWMGNGSVMPSRVRASTRAGRTPNSANEFINLFLGGRDGLPRQVHDDERKCGEVGREAGKRPPRQNRAYRIARVAAGCSPGAMRHHEVVNPRFGMSRSWRIQLVVLAVAFGVVGIGPAVFAVID